MFKNGVMAIELDDEVTWKRALAKTIDVAAGGSLHLVTVVLDCGLRWLAGFSKKAMRNGCSRQRSSIPLQSSMCLTAGVATA